MIDICSYWHHFHKHYLESKKKKGNNANVDDDEWLIKNIWMKKTEWSGYSLHTPHVVNPKILTFISFKIQHVSISLKHFIKIIVRVKSDYKNYSMCNSVLPRWVGILKTRAF